MKVTIRNLKSIKELAFSVPPPGVWILSGPNGSGKSSLLAALFRVSDSNAFQWYFKAGSLDSAVDRFDGAEVEYQIGGETVTYRYGGQRWRATPRRHATLLSRAGYAQVLYLEANSARIEPYPNEIRSNRVYACAEDLSAFLAGVLDDPKWNDLKYVYTTKGGHGKLRAYLVQQKLGGRNRYYSERSFSLGELCVLRLAVKVLAAPRESLLLVDEVEMALHPAAQVRLIERIRAIAEEMRHTVLFSTHSATIIKQTPRKQLLYLARKGDNNLVVEAAYPARVLGDICQAGELSIDHLFYVEDDHAQYLLEAMVERYFSDAELVETPKFRVVPVGGYEQVLNLLDSSTGIIPNHVARFAFLDLDARDSIRQRRQNINDPLNATSRRLESEFTYLPETPEVGLTSLLQEMRASQSTAHLLVTGRWPNALSDPRTIIASNAYSVITADNPRKRAKKQVGYFVDSFARSVNVPPNVLLRDLYRAWVEWRYPPDQRGLRGVLGPVFNRTRV